VTPNAGRSLRPSGAFARAGAPDSDASALSQAATGNADALAYLYVRHAADIRAYVASIVRDPHEAEDITQQVFAKLLMASPTFEPGEVPFRSWLLRVARNTAMDSMRRRRAVPWGEIPERSPSDEASGDRASAIREALRSLPEDQREVLVLRHLVGLSPGEIADRLGRSKPSVHALHHRGRGALKAQLLERHAGPAVAA